MGCDSEWSIIVFFSTLLCNNLKNPKLRLSVMFYILDHQGELRDDRGQGAGSWWREHHSWQKQQVWQLLNPLWDAIRWRWRFPDTFVLLWDGHVLVQLAAVCLKRRPRSALCTDGILWPRPCASGHAFSVPGPQRAGGADCVSMSGCSCRADGGCSGGGPSCYFKTPFSELISKPVMREINGEDSCCGVKQQHRLQFRRWRMKREDLLFVFFFHAALLTSLNAVQQYVLSISVLFFCFTGSL